MRVSLLVSQQLLVLLDISAAVEDGCLDLRHVLAETLILIADLEGQLAGVAHDQDRAFAGDWLDLLQGAENEDSRFSETGLRLAEDIGAEDGLRDTDLLDCGSSMLDFVRPTWSEVRARCERAGERSVLLSVRSSKPHL